MWPPKLVWIFRWRLRPEARRGFALFLDRDRDLLLDPVLLLALVMTMAVAVAVGRSLCRVEVGLLELVLSASLGTRLNVRSAIHALRLPGGRWGRSRSPLR